VLSAEALTYFHSPELGPSTVIDHSTGQIRPACDSLRATMHYFNAEIYGRAFHDLGEPVLPPRSRHRVVRVALYQDLAARVVVYRLEQRTLTIAWFEPDAPRPHDLTYETYAAWARAHMIPKRRTVTISRRDADQIWRIQHAVQPRREGDVGVVDANWLLVESVDRSGRTARVSILGFDGDADRLLCAMESLGNGSSPRCAAGH
jgi:hypothetical protein